MYQETDDQASRIADCRNDGKQEALSGLDRSSIPKRIGVPAWIYIAHNQTI
jgi:hypothetical protein